MVPGVEVVLRDSGMILVMRRLLTVNGSGLIQIRRASDKLSPARKWGLVVRCCVLGPAGYEL